MCGHKVICENAETCMQRLVICEHQQPHDVKHLNTRLMCIHKGYCSVAEIECKCILSH